MTINLAAGWNTFSTPVSLDPQLSTLAQIFAASDVEIMWGYNAATQAWITLPGTYVLQPCEAIYVFLNAPSNVVLHFNPALTAPAFKGLSARLEPDQFG